MFCWASGCQVLYRWLVSWSLSLPVQVSQQMMQLMSLWGPLIYAGCFAATLSSAIASLVGAPRVFQAVARDQLFPGWASPYPPQKMGLLIFSIFFNLMPSGISCFAKGWGPGNEPLRGYLLVFLIALVCILIGDLNQVCSRISCCVGLGLEGRKEGMPPSSPGVARVCSRCPVCCPTSSWPPTRSSTTRCSTRASPIRQVGGHLSGWTLQGTQ